MISHRRLSNPPIVEAIIDLQFEGSSAELGDIEKLADRFASKGWEKSPAHEAIFQVDPSQAEALAMVGAETSLVGYTVRDPASHVFFQLRPDRVTVSQALNYTEWDDLVADAMRALKAHIEYSRPIAIDRIGTRFLNRIALPAENFTDFGSILVFPPTAPPVGSLTDFFTQKVIKNIRGGFTSRMTLATVAPQPPDVVNAVLVDIDVFKECQLPPIPERLLPELRELRWIKNELFFTSVREEALEGWK